MSALYTLKEYLDCPENSDIANLEIVNRSYNMGNEYLGAYASTFRTKDNSSVYVVYRGTGVGRWYDNGDAFSLVSSRDQDDALEYFDATMQLLNLTSDTKLYVTGHSKEGNLSQYVTLSSEYRDLIDKCISFDGQGFSPEFITYEKTYSTFHPEK